MEKPNLEGQLDAYRGIEGYEDGGHSGKAYRY